MIALSLALLDCILMEPSARELKSKYQPCQTEKLDFVLCEKKLGFNDVQTQCTSFRNCRLSRSVRSLRLEASI